MDASGAAAPGPPCGKSRSFSPPRSHRGDREMLPGGGSSRASQTMLFCSIPKFTVVRMSSKGAWGHRSGGQSQSLVPEQGLTPPAPPNPAARSGGQGARGQRSQPRGLILGWSCVEQGVGLDGPCGSQRTESMKEPPWHVTSSSSGCCSTRRSILQAPGDRR